MLNAGRAEIVLHGNGQKRLAEDTPKLVFEVDDIEVVRERLVAQGVTMDAIFSPAPGVKVSNGFDPEGTPFSIDWHAS